MEHVSSFPRRPDGARAVRPDAAHAARDPTAFRFSLSALARFAWALARSSLAPPACAACDVPVSLTAIFCPMCARTVEQVEPPSSRAFKRGMRRARAPCDGARVAFAQYGGAVATAIRRFKFERRPDLAQPLGELVRMAARRTPMHADLVVPVPLHGRRLAERGYNQAALLAHSLSAELGVPMRPRALVRLRDTQKQTDLGRLQRRSNVSDAFRASARSMVEGRHVVLVDDVLTTGATLDACESALRSAGALSVAAVVVASADSLDA